SAGRGISTFGARFCRTVIATSGPMSSVLVEHQPAATGQQQSMRDRPPKLADQQRVGKPSGISLITHGRSHNFWKSPSERWAQTLADTEKSSS
ncbi:MAG: hypothetical protein J4O05_07800, partial [Chloroflexi bacterium]|nr:hypothetical protein [Chloroflexota bacterium]